MVFIMRQSGGWRSGYEIGKQFVKCIFKFILRLVFAELFAVDRAINDSFEYLAWKLDFLFGRFTVCALRIDIGRLGERRLWVRIAGFNFVVIY